MQSRLSTQAPSSAVFVSPPPALVPLVSARSHRRYQHDPNCVQHPDARVPQAACRAAASLAVVSRLAEQEGFSRASLPELQFRDMDAVESHSCPCGSHKRYSACCGPLLSGSPAAVYGPAELARARFTAHLLANLEFLERTMHPDNPDYGHPQMVARACAVFQALEPKLLDMCHAHVPGSEEAGEAEIHIVATALMVQRDSTAPAHIFVEVDRYQLLDGKWQHHGREHHLPTYGPFLIFMDKYGPGSSRGSVHASASGDRAAGAAGGEHSSIIVGGGRYKYDLVSPRRTPTASRGATPSASRVPSPQLQRRGFTPQVARQQRLTPQPHRTHSMLHSPQPQRRPGGTPQAARLTPQPVRPALSGGSSSSNSTPQPNKPRATPQPHYRRPTPSPSSSTSQQGTPQLQRQARGGLVAGSAGSAAALAALGTAAGVHSHHLLADAWPTPASTNSDLVYLDDDESNSSSNSSNNTTSLTTTSSSKQNTAADAQQLSAQQEMMHMVHGADSTDADSWLFKQSGFRYEV